MADKETVEDAEVIDRGDDVKSEDKPDATSKEDAVTDDLGSKNKKEKKPSSQDTPTPKSGSSDNLHGEKVKVNWADNDHVVENYVAQPTAESTAEDAEASLKNEGEMSEEDENAFIEGRDQESEEESQMSVEDLKFAAEFVVELLDGLNSIGVGAWTKESASTFELSASKKKTLILLLAKVMYRYQARVGPLATLVLASLLYFGMTWKTGFDIKKQKKEEAQKKAIEAKKEKNRKKKEAFRNKIQAAVGIENVTLKEISQRMGMKSSIIKPELKILCDQGLIFADHKKPIIHYKLAE